MLKFARQLDRDSGPYVKPAPRGPVMPCAECGKAPVFDQLSSHLCEVCWSLKARQWFASGLTRNAFQHQVRR